jgi:hypothetical protein
MLWKREYDEFAKSSQCFWKEIVITFSRLRNDFPDTLRRTSGRYNLFVETFGTTCFFSPAHSKHLLAKKEDSLKSVSE